MKRVLLSNGAALPITLAAINPSASAEKSGGGSAGGTGAISSGGRCRGGGLVGNASGNTSVGSGVARGSAGSPGGTVSRDFGHDRIFRRDRNFGRFDRDRDGRFRSFAFGFDYPGYDHDYYDDSCYQLRRVPTRTAGVGVGCGFAPTDPADPVSEPNDLSSNRHPALHYSWSMIPHSRGQAFSENRYPPRSGRGRLFRNRAALDGAKLRRARRSSKACPLPR
jgi:hypothetical protein